MPELSPAAAAAAATAQRAVDAEEEQGAADDVAWFRNPCFCLQILLPPHRW